MATPHNAGLIALMLSKNPNITPAEIDSILETTALELPPANKDNDHGAGRIQALDAVNAVPALPTPNFVYVGNFVDDAAGNGNGLADPGETVTMVDTIKNLGANATGVTGVLRTTNPNVTLLDSTGAFGDIATLAVGYNDPDRFSFSVAPATPPGSIANFQVELTANGGSF
ncbi:MAG: S8 family serine peptidase [Candidatus Edwardsbacteria bacterium]